MLVCTFMIWSKSPTGEAGSPELCVNIMSNLGEGGMLGRVAFERGGLCLLPTHRNTQLADRWEEPQGRFLLLKPWDANRPLKSEIKLLLGLGIQEQSLIFIFMIYPRDKLLVGSQEGITSLSYNWVLLGQEQMKNLSHFKQNDVPWKENLLVEFPFLDDFIFRSI